MSIKERLCPRQAIFWAVLIVAFVFGGRNFADAAQIKFSAALDKTEYAPDEPINVTFTLKNAGKAPVYVNRRFYISSEEAPKNQKEVYFIITSPLGVKLPCKYTYETGYPKTDYFELLESGKEVKSEYPRNLKGTFEFSETGTYKLVAVYQNGYGAEIGVEVFKDKLTSAPVSFTIAKLGSPEKDTAKK